MVQQTCCPWISHIHTITLKTSTCMSRLTILLQQTVTSGYHLERQKMTALARPPLAFSTMTVGGVSPIIPTFKVCCSSYVVYACAACSQTRIRQFEIAELLSYERWLRWPDRRYKMIKAQTDGGKLQPVFELETVCAIEQRFRCPVGIIPRSSPVFYPQFNLACKHQLSFGH